MTTLKMHSPNLVDDNIAKIATLFPNCITEKPKTDQDGNPIKDKDGNIILEQGIDFEILKQELSHHLIDGSQERYRLDWVGKREAILTANSPIAKTLRPYHDESVDFDNTGNLFIEGDNLEALKLLQESYLGAVKMIYIDPPYNTGNDFIYNDDFSEDTESFFARSGQVDDNGNRLIANTESNGRFHSDWLSMMYSRLKLARNLLSDDGVIFISIDDNEVHNLRKICDEIFGAENFISNISLKMKNVAGASGGGEDKKLKKNIEHLLAYTKNYYNFKQFYPVFELTEIGNLVQLYKLENKSWKYTSVIVNLGDKKYITSTLDGSGDEIKIFSRSNYEILSVSELAKRENISETEVYEKYAKRIFQTAMPQSSIRPRVIKALEGMNFDTDLFSIEYTPKSGRNKGVAYEQFYKGEKFRLFSWLSDVSEEIDGKLYKKEMQGTFWDLTSKMNNLSKEGDVSFDNGKKPIFLIKRLIEMMGDKNALILDFFAGSATTAHAVMQLNSEDNGNRKFIMVQINENINKNKSKEVYDFCKENNLPTTIAEISKERIRRAGAKIKAENVGKDGVDTLDTGFRVLKIDTSNMADIYYRPDDYRQDLLDDLVDTVKADRSDEDLLFGFMLDMGVALSLPIERTNIGGHTVYQVGGNSLVASLDYIDAQMIDDIARLAPIKFVTSERAIATDSDKTNIIERFKQLSPHTDVRFI